MSSAFYKEIRQFNRLNDFCVFFFKFQIQVCKIVLITNHCPIVVCFRMACDRINSIQSTFQSFLFQDVLRNKQLKIKSEDELKHSANLKE